MQAIEIVNIEGIKSARRQLEICNACRYCESYCSVFPAVHEQRSFSDAQIKQLANLCHNCRGCHYACQYSEPHQFNINIPKALAEVRQDSWHEFAKPRMLAKVFHKSPIAVTALVIAAFTLLLWLIQYFNSSTSGEGASNFYTLMSHNAMMAIFLPAFVLPIIAIGMSIRAYWSEIGGQKITLSHLSGAIGSVSSMKNLAAGHGQGCNFEDEDRFSHARRRYHQATMYGFLLCFGATSAGTLLHYLLNLQAPYDLVSIPKILGVSGGILLSVGTAGLASLKWQADRSLSDARVWAGEMAFIALLFVVSSSGLLLYWVGSSAWLGELLAFHLSTVLAFFLLMPYTKMQHGFYRMASLIRDEQRKQTLTANNKN